MEAMGAGLPIVSSEAGGVPEMFEDPEHGRFWPLDDAQRGAEILIDLLESEQEVQRAGRAALEKFRSDFDAEVVAPRLVSFLRSTPAMTSDVSSPLGHASSREEGVLPAVASTKLSTARPKVEAKRWARTGEALTGGHHGHE
jgi:hypothetical protein